ncbi:MAG: hypothetical protein H8D23_11060 [Candidatus Brocadiales bacterium]|nr:hypothetical protein [Candidatus Brocadiales bacterium]
MCLKRGGYIKYRRPRHLRSTTSKRIGWKMLNFIQGRYYDSFGSARLLGVDYHYVDAKKSETHYKLRKKYDLADYRHGFHACTTKKDAIKFRELFLQRRMPEDGIRDRLKKQLKIVKVELSYIEGSGYDYGTGLKTVVGLRQTIIKEVE